MDHLLNALDAKTTLLTPNRRLARTLTEAYGAQRQAAGEQTWQTPDILPWSASLQRCWGEAGQNLAMADQPVEGLLTSLQERVVWEQVIHDAGEEYSQLQPAGAARLAQEAWSLLHDWRLDLRQEDFALGEDTRAFYPTFRIPQPQLTIFVRGCYQRPFEQQLEHIVTHNSDSA